MCIAIYTNIFIFLLKCHKKGSSTVHCGYYVCYHLHANTDVKYLKSLIEEDSDLSITTKTYQL
jgi:hypothetical protein